MKKKHIMEWRSLIKDNFKKAISPSGEVHYVTSGLWKNGSVIGPRKTLPLLCNRRFWISDRGKPWKAADKTTLVTCENCIRAFCQLGNAIR